MKKCKRGAWILASILLLGLTSTAGVGQKKGAFPGPEELRQSNVCLEIQGFQFTSGLAQDAQGNLDLNGLGVKGVSWNGSGFIVSADGTLLTNAHVARKALQGKAIFEDGASYDINQIRAFDPANDIAVLKIRAQRQFSPVVLGNSDLIDIMDPVLAVGNTLGFGLQVTNGIINQVIRDNDDVRRQFRHSAATAPGNSGGAIYSGSEVVGIHFAGISQYQMYYAVPINLAKPLLSSGRSWVQLPEYFNPQTIPNKVEEIFSRTGQAPAATSERQGQGRRAEVQINPSMNGFSVELPREEDFVIQVQAEQGRHLPVLVYMANPRNPNEPMLAGCSNVQQGQTEVLLFSTERLQTTEFFVGVINSGLSPCRYALTVYRINW